MENVAHWDFTLKEVSDINLRFSQRPAPENLFSCISLTHIAKLKKKTHLKTHITNYFK